MVDGACLPQGVSSLDCVPTGMAILWVCALHGPHDPCSYCTSGFWNASDFCFIYDSLLRALLHTLLRALLLLRALSNSACLSALSLVLEHPRSWLSRPSLRVCSQTGASLGSACRGVLAHLCCSSSSGDECCLATI